MTTSRKSIVALSLVASLFTLALLLVAACTSERPTSTPAPEAPQTASPAATTAATAMPVATAMPTVTTTSAATSTPSPTSVPTQATTSTSAATPTQPPASTPSPAPIQTPAITATPVPTPTPEPIPKPPPPTGPIAPELVGTQEWVNSDPLTIQELRGKVVLIDFWTYTCVNCIRTLPYLKVWHSKYADDGLVIIGVHTPEFRFEHDIDNVRQAVSDYSVEWPVVQDNNFDTWDAFSNRYWPAKYLIDQNGVIRYQHYGEGAYAETETMIRELIEETGVNLSAVAPLAAPNQDLDFAFKNSIGAEITAELYGGYERSCSLYSLYANSSIAAQDYCRSKDQVVEYTDTGVWADHSLYLQGSWLAERESLRHARDTSNYEDYMLLRFSAKSVNVVLTPERDEPFKVLVHLDGEYLNEFNKGEDVVIDDDGTSYLIVDKPRLYAVVEAPEYGTYDLQLSSNSSDFALFAFTFGVYETGI